MNRLIKNEFINCRVNRFKQTTCREIKRSCELSSIRAKEQVNEDLDYSKSAPLKQEINPLKSKHNLKYLMPKIELKRIDENKFESNYNLQFENNLLSFLYASINTNSTKDGLKTIEYYQDQKSMLFKLGQFRSLKLINVLVKNYALNGNLDRVENCLHLIERLNFKPDLVFYSYFLYALAKDKQFDEISSLVAKICNDQPNLNALFEDCFLNSEQRSFLIDALLKCDIQLNSTSKEIEYATKLLSNYQQSTAAKFSPLQGIEFDENLFNQQLGNEKDIFVKMKSAFNVSRNELNESLINETEKEWNRRLKKAFDHNLNLMKIQNEDDNRINIYPFLNFFNKDKLTRFLVAYIVELTKFKFPSNFNYLSSQIGSLLENQYLSIIKLKNTKNLKSFYKNYFEFISDENRFTQLNSRQLFKQKFLDLNLYNRELNEMVWSSKTKKDVGNYVLETCIETLRFNSNLLKGKSKSRPKILPALFKTTQFEKGKRNDILTPNNQLNKLTSQLTSYSLISAKDLPMLVPPFPWNSAEGFPFLISKLFLLIEPSIIYEQKIAEKIRNFNINAVLDSLNYTSLIPWKVNDDILNILNRIFEDGGDYKLDIPHHHTKMPELPKKEQEEDIVEFKRKMFRVKKQNREMYSLWCEMNYKLSIANYLKDKLFWFPNLIDFRGRVYPTSIYLSQVSNDVGRSLLLFGKGKKLGANGFDWLKIHLINLTGTKKSSTNQERLEYANKLMPHIIDSAENPLDSKAWWKQSDDPWQTLACCIEINKILKSNENPEEFISHFPVHQDGSCNGLQHYAALGRDFDGARSVNLLPKDRPADVYAEVAALVNKKRIIDASNGDENAIALDGFINRKLVKATVMTNVYGVTSYGAKLQFKKVLEEVDSFPKEKLSSCSSYLASVVFNIIEDLFTCSKEIQDWLTAISIAISKRLNVPVEWVTPLGLPVVQYYFKKNNKIIVDANRQRNGCAPNYIHSLDATHMMLTSLYCEKKGINFVSVHDSFWTHASDIEEMSKTLREQFVNLYSDDLLTNLSNYFLSIYKPYLVENSSIVDKSDLQILNLIKNVPNRGKFEIKQVLDSKYFFS